jgi:hypothetical protein
VGLLGAGALGTAVAYVLLKSRAKAELMVIDPQSYDDPNLETCILAEHAAVSLPMKKADFLAEALAGEGITARAERRRIEAGDGLLKEKWDAFICGVDNPETRRILDETNTGMLLNAGLGDTKEDAGFVLWTRHGSGDALLSETYAPLANNGGDNGKEGPAIPREFRDVCTRMAYQGVSLSIPFAALAAGSLLVAGLYHVARGEAPADNYFQMDLFGKQSRYLKEMRG